MKSGIPRRIGWSGKAIVILLCAPVMAALCVAAVSAEQLGDVQITLHSCTYYRQADVTRVVYKVKSTPNPPPSYWILEVGECVTAEDIVAGASTAHEWVEEPFRGLRFTPSRTNEKVYLYLEGQWDLTEGRVLAAFPDAAGSEVTYEGRLDVPLCRGASISIRIVSGSSVAFPEIDGAGTYEATRSTHLQVESTSSGWTLQESLVLSAPDGASTETLSRVFGLAVADYWQDAGTTDIHVSYALSIEESDFTGLPEGSYVIGITFTVALD